MPIILRLLSWSGLLLHILWSYLPRLILAGDFSTDLQTKNFASIAVNKYCSNELYHCDFWFPVACRRTQCKLLNSSTHVSNAIDYMLTSSAEKVVAFNILDVSINWSHHLPIMAVCLTGVESEILHEHSLPSEVTHLRWDHAPIRIL